MFCRNLSNRVTSELGGGGEESRLDGCGMTVSGGCGRLWPSACHSLNLLVRVLRLQVGVAGAGRARGLHVMKQGCFNVINVNRRRRCRRRYLKIISRPSANGRVT